jgi:hypothetical protein
MNRIKTRLSEELTFDLIEQMIGEDYPSTFDMGEFKKLNSFKKRIEYCNKHLKRISSGSSRVVFMIDNEKVLKLAKNQKGLAQNEVEIQYGNEGYLEDIVAKVYDYDKDNLWLEMQLAKKLTKSKFKQITGFNFDDFATAVHNYGIDSGNAGRHAQKRPIDPKIVEEMWEDEFVYGIFDFIGNYGIPVGDLTRLNSYGVVTENGVDRVVIIDYGLTHDVYQSFYS